MKKLSAKEIAKMIDHSLLLPQMTRDEVAEGCDIAIKYNTASVCVRPYDIEFCKERLKGTDVMVCAVTGFPHGNSTTASKLCEVSEAIDLGAEEIDVVIAIGLAKSGMWDYVKEEVSRVLGVCAAKGAVLKVIFENAYLTADEIVTCCKICDELNVGFVKTSTGYAPSGAREEDLKLMRANTKRSVEIKAAGGVKTLDQFLAYYELGVTRQGMRATAEVVEEAIRRGL